MSRRYTKHGFSRHGAWDPLYTCWMNMILRCTNKVHRSYSRYGGRGITVYKPWRESFVAFKDYVLSEIGPRPSPKYTFDRWPDPDGNYEPGNVRWATRKQQANNWTRSIASTAKRSASAKHGWESRRCKYGKGGGATGRPRKENAL